MRQDYNEVRQRVVDAVEKAGGELRSRQVEAVLEVLYAVIDGEIDALRDIVEDLRDDVESLLSDVAEAGAV